MIDTRLKRASLIGGLLPWPDGTLDRGDRQVLLDLYAGIYLVPVLFFATVYHVAMTQNGAASVSAASNAQPLPRCAITNTV